MPDMPFDLAVIDLDNTLYAANNGVFARMDRRMTAYVASELEISEKAANDLRRRYWKQYGTTLRGLMLHHGLEPEPFLAYVHDINIHQILKPDTELNAALDLLPGRKVIYTNGIHEHACRVLKALHVGHHFDRIYDIRFNAYMPKPCSRTFAMLLESEGTDPSRALLVDDMADNLKIARNMGAKTAWITGDTSPSGWDYQISRIHNLAKCLNPDRQARETAKKLA